MMLSVARVRRNLILAPLRSARAGSYRNSPSSSIFSRVNFSCSSSRRAVVSGLTLVSAASFASAKWNRAIASADCAALHPVLPASLEVAPSEFGALLEDSPRNSLLAAGDALQSWLTSLWEFLTQSVEVVWRSSYLLYVYSPALLAVPFSIEQCDDSEAVEGNNFSSLR